MRKIEAILIGCGMVGGGIVKESYRRGVRYAAAFDIKPELIGHDIGEAIQEPFMDCPVYHVGELESFLNGHKIDIAVNTASAPASVTMPQMRLLLSHGVNVVTSLADIYAMEHYFPELYAELDALGKARGATLFASGIQDVFWTALPAALTGCCLDIKEIKGTNVALIDYFGPGVADECYVGWDLDKFDKASASGELPVNDFLIALYELARTLHLHPNHESSKIKPLLAKTDTYFETIERGVKAGQLLGNFVESIVKTDEGIVLCCDFVSKMSEPGDTDLNKWEISGVPTINIITERMQGEITTGSNIVNRIPDVINAAPGVVSAGEMPAPFYKSRGLNEYVK